MTDFEHEDRAPDDEGWEDVDDSQHIRSRYQSAPPSAAASTDSFSVTSEGAGSLRKRSKKQRGVITHQAASARRPQTSSRLVRRIPPSDKPQNGFGKEDLQDALSSGVVHASLYTADVLGTVIRLLKRPLVLFLFFWLLAYMLGRASSAIRTTLAPLCILPGIARLCYAPPAPAAPRAPQWADYPRLMEMQGQTLETLLEETADGPGLALEIKKAEMATSDLAMLVRVSDLTSRDRLADALADFVGDARRTGRDLQRFTARVGGAVDNILAVGDYALHAIEGADAKSHSSLSLRHLWPFSDGDSAQTKEVVRRTFEDAMNTLSVNMERLILEAEVSIADLDKLEQRLLTVYELASREDAALQDAQADLLAQLWTQLGGNRRELRKFDGHRALLANLGAYRARAAAHVVAALQTLQSMSGDMEDLRERVAAPQLVGERIPLDVHMKSIRKGLERLQDRRVRAEQREREITDRVVSRSHGGLALGS